MNDEHVVDSEGMRFVRVALLGTPLYEEPDKTAAKLAYLNKGSLMEVLDEKWEFLHVQTTDHVAGYVLKRATVSE